MFEELIVRVIFIRNLINYLRESPLSLILGVVQIINTSGNIDEPSSVICSNIKFLELSSTKASYYIPIGTSSLEPYFFSTKCDFSPGADDSSSWLSDECYLQKKFLGWSPIRFQSELI